MIYIWYILYIYIPKNTSIWSFSAICCFHSFLLTMTFSLKCSVNNDSKLLILLNGMKVVFSRQDLHLLLSEDWGKGTYYTVTTLNWILKCWSDHASSVNLGWKYDWGALWLQLLRNFYFSSSAEQLRNFLPVLSGGMWGGLGARFVFSSS